MYDLIGYVRRIFVSLWHGKEDIDYSGRPRLSVHYASLCLSRLSLRFRARREGHQRSISHVDINTRVHF